MKHSRRTMIGWCERRTVDSSLSMKPCEEDERQRESLESLGEGKVGLTSMPNRTPQPMRTMMKILRTVSSLVS